MHRKQILITALVLIAGTGMTAFAYARTHDTPAAQTTDSQSVKASSDTSEQNGQQPEPTTNPAAEAAGRAIDPAMAAPDSVQIAIIDKGYTPAAVSITTGKTIVWVNNDAQDHSITGLGTDAPKSGALEPGERYAYTFTKIGTYTYYSSQDKTVRGTITVTE